MLAVHQKREEKGTRSMTTSTPEEPQNGEAAKPVINYRGWKAMPYVIGNEAFEKLGTFGTSANLLVYLTTVFHMKSVASATLVTVFNGTTNLAPLLGAFLADTYLGRYATLGAASIASLLGMLILTLTAAVSKLHPSPCSSHGDACHGANQTQLAVLFASYVFMVIGAGGIRPCNLAFGADQFDPTTEAGKRGIASFFNWYYMTFTFAMMASSTLVIYVQSNVSWSLGLAIPTAFMFISSVLFFVGTKIYVKVRPEGSPITSIAQVLVAAFRKRALKLPDDLKGSLFDPPHLSSLISKLPHTDQFSFLDKAAIITPMDDIKPDGSASDGWRLCSLQQVEQMKCLVRIIPVWSSCIIFEVTVVLTWTYVVFQALQSDRHLGHSNFEIPAATFTVFTMAAMTIWLLVYDRFVVRLLQRVTGKEGGITLLQRMGTGIALSVVMMIVGGLVEERRRSYALHKPTLGTASNGGAISSMSSLWLIPQLVIAGLSDAFNLVGQVEFYYKQFPENMRSMAGGLLFLGFACSNYLGSLIITIVHRTTGGHQKSNWLAEDLNQGRLDLLYFSIASVCAVNLVFFIVCAKWYKYKTSDKDHEIALQTKEIRSSV
ncbi:protein NRT1/ PTR FAMILY 2.11-like isoform X1 [Musa acuminata AAA Group]|uniref:protein NRT1/ PTR FAMILY 2.11-like isoform X1 n=2 Tax=Musa acuminata AAA Group TaxID=214697 RepID=UPI0031E09CF3